MTSEAEMMKDLLTSITGVPFRIDTPKENRLLLKKHAVWFVWSTSILSSRRAVRIKAAWKNYDGSIWLESPKVADMVALVERAYGEKGAVSMPDAKEGVAPGEGIPEEVVNYPKVVKLLRTYDGIIDQLSKKRGIELKILRDGGVGVTTIRIGARLNTITEGETLEELVIDAAKVLREAYDALREVEA